MDQRPSEDVAVMAIRERYVTRILDGSKRVEFRRTALRKVISHVVVYESRGRGKIVGYFEVANVTNAKPRKLWNLFSEAAGIGRSEFFEYFRGKEEGTGISVGVFYRLDDPIDITSINPSYHPPQSFFYLQDGEFERVLQRKAERAVCSSGSARVGF